MITFLYGFNRSDSINQLLAGYGGDINRFEVGTLTWTGLSEPISVANDGFAAAFLDNFFFVDGVEMRRGNGIGFIDEIATKKAPLASYILAPLGNARIFLAKLTFNGLTYSSRVWYSDLPKNNDVTYGLEYGVGLKQTAGSAVVRASVDTYFKTRNIQEGYPFLIIDGPNAGEYEVVSVDSENQVTLSQPMVTTATSRFWTGNNWFDVVTNDNDVMTALGENSGRVLCFKRNSLHRYDGQSLTPIKGVKGTSSQRSVVNIGDYTYYFHPDTGIWQTDSQTATIISYPMHDFIAGMDKDFANHVTAWPVGETKQTLRVFIGDVTNVAAGITVTNCFLDYDTITQTWCPGSLPFAVRAATKFIENNTENYYLGDDNNTVYLSDSGNADAGSSIELRVETGWIFPIDPTIELQFTTAMIFSQRGRGVKVAYRLYGTPFRTSADWTPLGSLTDTVTEINLEETVDKPIIGRGIKFLLTDSGIKDSPLIERIDIFYRPSSARSL